MDLGGVMKSILCLVNVIAVTILVSCGYSEQTFRGVILSDSPCTAPCWQGITPGNRMSKEEVIEVLRALPNVGTTWEPRPGDILWRWKAWPSGEMGYNSVALRSGVVQSIALYVPFELTVADILNKYGAPEAINWLPSPLPEDAYIGLNIFYPTRGLQFKAEVRPWNEPVLEPTTRVTEAVYYRPAESLGSWMNSNPDILVQPWRGYGKLVIPWSKDLPSRGLTSTPKPN